VDLEDDRGSLLSIVYQDGWRCRADVNMCPTDELTLDSLRALSRTLMDVVFYGVHFYFLQEWSRHDRTSDPVLQFRCLQVALYDTHNLDVVQVPAASTTAWSRMALSESHARCSRDTFVLSKLKPYHAKTPRLVTALRQDSALSSLAIAMHALHLLGEAYKLQKDKHVYLVRLASCICNLAVHVRPEWADYWKRLLPDAMEEWPDPSQYSMFIKCLFIPKCATHDLFF
jgi:anaphase-promoting complex subunit 1